ncbi:MAG: hypothetical protein ACREQ5_20900 [Candidatus Dormibacteria bacterium]
MSNGPVKTFIYGQPFGATPAVTAGPIPLLCDSTGILLTGPAGVALGGGTVVNQQSLVQANSDGVNQNDFGLTQVSFSYGFNGASFDRVRIPVIFKTIAATAAGLTPVWTPAAGKSFRLMGYSISVAGTLAATGVQLIQLRDGAATIIQRQNATVTITTPTDDSHMGVDLGQGILSAAPNNVLNINLGTAMASGEVDINVWGTEE